jgi:hypothetical protein
MAVDVAVVAARCGTIIDAVALQGATVAAHATAVDHIVAVQIAAVAVGEPLVAVSAAAAFTDAPLHAATASGMTSGSTEQREEDRDTEPLEDLLEHHCRILSTSDVK